MEQFVEDGLHDISLRPRVVSEGFEANAAPKRILLDVQPSKFKDTTTNGKAPGINLINLVVFSYAELSYQSIFPYFDPRLLRRFKKLIRIAEWKTPFAPG